MVHRLNFLACMLPEMLPKISENDFLAVVTIRKQTDLNVFLKSTVLSHGKNAYRERKILRVCKELCKTDNLKFVTGKYATKTETLAY